MSGVNIGLDRTVISKISEAVAQKKLLIGIKLAAGKSIIIGIDYALSIAFFGGIKISIGVCAKVWYERIVRIGFVRCGSVARRIIRGSITVLVLQNIYCVQVIDVAEHNYESAPFIHADCFAGGRFSVVG